jgi:pimeloyl-ACP methyl ester carboxylesterase
VSPEGGYDGLALHHSASRSLVIVNRGTEGVQSIPDWLENLGASFLREPGPQLDDALDMLGASFEALGGDRVDQILIVGHSLGGALADAQGAYAAALFAQKGLTCPPVRVVGAASAGFAGPAQAVAERRGLQAHPNAPRFITHYIRAEDIVPHHPNRSVFGTDRKIASVYETRAQPPTAPHATGLEWRWLADLLRQHMPSLYFQFLEEPDDRHIWFSVKTGAYEGRDGGRPTWTPKLRRPKDW